MPDKDEPFGNAPDLKRAFEDARDGKAPPAAPPREQEKQQGRTEAPGLHYRPRGVIRRAVDDQVRQGQSEDEARRVAERKEGGERDGKKPRRVTQLARAFNREKDKGREP
ncbi:MAG: hypothetical protein IPK66_06160 [Rhodospirillales bacterium]|nr:hypothetical protein [Rhodospirillales bacterium]